MVLPKNKFAKYWSMRFYLGVPLCEAWEIPARHRKSRQGIGNPGKAWKILGKHGRYQEFRESTGNPSPGSAVKTRKIPGFFSR